MRYFKPFLPNRTHTVLPFSPNPLERHVSWIQSQIQRSRVEGPRHGGESPTFSRLQREFFLRCSETFCIPPSERLSAGDGWRVYGAVCAIIASILTGIHTALNCDAHQTECGRLVQLYSGLESALRQRRFSTTNGFNSASTSWRRNSKKLAVKPRLHRHNGAAGAPSCIHSRHCVDKGGRRGRQRQDAALQCFRPNENGRLSAAVSR